MLEEARESAQVVAAQFADTARVEALAARLAHHEPAVALTVARGRNPDAPRHLNKVTETH